MSTQLGVNSNYYSNKLNPNPVPGKILARVDKVILGPTEANGQPDKDFQNNGAWGSIGAIRFTVMYGGEAVDNVTNTIARPYYPNNTQYPLKGEIVELTFGPSTRLNDGGLEKDLYYKNPISLWNSVHHNAFPNLNSLATFNSNLTVPYADATKGITDTTVTGSQPYPLGATFVEKSTIKNLQPFEGDIIYQGRWGQSIRFGNTVKNSATKNPWSSTGNNGDPIIIITNGQAATKGDPWVPTIEDVNNDAASIILSSGQAIIIQDLNNFKLDSYTIDVKLTEDNTRAIKKQPISTDTTSPTVQSQFELQYAQVSAEVNIPSTAPTSSLPVSPVTESRSETGGDLEVIVAEESDLRFSFEIDNSGDPAIIVQDDVPDTTSPSPTTEGDKSPSDVYYYPCAVFNQGDPRWGSNAGGGYSLKAAGCCYTSFAMMTTYHKKDNTYTPQWFWNNAKKSTVVYWGEMAKAVNLSSSGAIKVTSTGAIDERLKKGPVMFEWDNTNKASKTKYAKLYTKRHHWMLIIGKGIDGTYTVLDPNGGKLLKNQTKEQIEAGLIRISYIL